MKDLIVGLAPSIFVRRYDDKCIVWNTKNQGIFVLEGNSYELLILLKEPKSLEEVIKQIENEYVLDKEDVTAIYSFVEDCIRQGICISHNSVTSHQLEDEVLAFTASNKILYSVLFELTYGCNERCKHCYVDSRDKKRELSKTEIYGIIDQLNDANVAMVTFTGGDIFTRTDAMDIIEYTIKNNIVVDIFSNGIALTNEMVSKLSDLHIRSFQCSIYGSNDKTHDAITGVNGSFNKTVNRIKWFIKEGVPVCIKVVLIKENIEEYEDIIELGERLGASIQVSVSIRPTMTMGKEPTELRADSSSIYSVLKSEYKRLKGDNQYCGSPQNDSGICNAGWNMLSINPYGDVYICQSLGEKLGNLKETHINTIWNELKIIREWRKVSKDKLVGCDDCKLKKYCNFCPSQAFLEEGGWNKKYNEACKLAELYSHIY